jgi:hypothetical protein
MRTEAALAFNEPERQRPSLEMGFAQNRLYGFCTQGFPPVYEELPRFVPKGFEEFWIFIEHFPSCGFDNTSYPHAGLFEELSKSPIADCSPINEA